MNKVLNILVLIVVVFSVVPTMSIAHTDLIAGGGHATSGIDVGDLFVWNDGDYLYVLYGVTDDDSCLTETHLHVAASLDGIPQKNGNPIPGQFKYKDTQDCVTEWSYTIPLDWDPNTKLHIAAQAVINNKVGPENAKESAWGDGFNFLGKNWGMYFTYVVAGGTPHFSGTVSYDLGTPRPQSGVSVTLWGYPTEQGEFATLPSYSSQDREPVLLDMDVSEEDGTFELVAQESGFDRFALIKDDPRGFVPGRALSAPPGQVYDANMVVYPGTVAGDICCTEFVLLDPFYARVPRVFWERYLIITTEEVVPSLTDFIDYKKFLGLQVVVKTVEELDPLNRGGNYLRNQIRNYERTLNNTLAGLRYVLLIGTDNTIPFLKFEATGDDWGRKPYADWPSVCKDLNLPWGPNNCGWPTDWFYVDLTSDWDSNGDGFLAERMWASDTVRDSPPAFSADVLLGRLPFDDPATVQNVLETIISYEQDGGSWKSKSLLAAAMMDYGERSWDSQSQNYVLQPGPTDAARLMERVWSDILLPQGFSRVSLYEKAYPPTGFPPSPYPADAPVSRQEMRNWWQGQDYGLVKAAGHGDARNVFRKVWWIDFLANGQVENPTEPLNGASIYELTDERFLASADANLLLGPPERPPVLMVMACDTGQWARTDNLAATFLSRGRISAWTGGSGTIKYHSNWTQPSHGGAFTIDYNITNALITGDAVLGRAVWSGLSLYHSTFNADWGDGKWDWGFMGWNLYGDPSMKYWGNGPDLLGSWPMFHHDWLGTGESPLPGPAGLVLALWTFPLAQAAPDSRVASPVVDSRGRIIIGDGNGGVHALRTDGSYMWTYNTGGPINNAAAISQDGTVYVHSADGLLYAINEDGSLRWASTVGQSGASPKIGADGIIYVGGSDNGGPGESLRYLLIAYRPNGTRAASFQVDGRITTTPLIAPPGHVWVGTETGIIYRMSQDLSETSSFSISTSPIGDGLALADDPEETILVPSLDGRLYAWSSVSDEIRWYFEASGEVRSAPALGSNGTVFFGSRDGNVYALRLSDGYMLWDHDTGGAVDSSPALGPINLYVVGGDPARLYIFRKADGSFTSLNPQIGGTSTGAASPAIGESRKLYVASNNGDLSALMAFGLYELEPPFLYPIPRPWEVYLSWDPVDPLAWVRLERRDPGGQWTELITAQPGVTEFVDSTVTPGQHYQYRAIAFAGPQATLSPPPHLLGLGIAEASEYSPIVQVRAFEAIPEDPDAPEITSISSSELHLTWTAASPGTTSLLILRQDATQNGFEALTVLPGEVTEFVDSELASDTFYAYRLQAIGEAGVSGQGRIGDGKTWSRSLPAPSNVVVTRIDSTTFEICWTPGAEDAYTVIARRPRGAAKPEVLAEGLNDQVCFLDENAYPYFFEYWVKHTGDQNESDWARSLLQGYE